MENTTTNNMDSHKPLYQYAGTIKRNWDTIAQDARPFIDAMFQLDQITDETARETVIRFLTTSRGWKGDIARDVKKELKKIANVQAD